MKNKINLILFLCLILSLTTINISATEVKDSDYKITISKEIEKIENKYSKKMNNEFRKYYVNKMISKEEYKHNCIVLQLEEKNDIQNYFESIGYKKVGTEPQNIAKYNEVSILTTSTDLQVVQDAFASTEKEGEIYYYAIWQWSDYDTLWDTYDLVSAQIQDDNGWRWSEIAVKTYSSLGDQTGYANGTTTTGDGVSLRSDFWRGSIFNIYDLYHNVGGLTNVYKTKKIKIYGWIDPGTTNSNYVKSDFEHNYKSYTLQGTASYSTNLNSFTLGVSYTQVNNNFSRGTNALLITKP